ncbi:MAG: phage tail protein [Pseudomonadota bacterium]
MATLVLTTIGTAVGGPIGGAIGALLGQAADARIFAPPGRKGPRLSDLRIQTSSYGSAIPRLLGRMRVSGTVIWATDLTEHRNRSGGGKGRPSTTNYSYSASFAVALSSRAIEDVGRIWAEGNIFRGQDGTFKSTVGFRLYRGGEDQPVDPLIASAEGVANCPAYRGLAYAVFEDMDLSPFGNRIPSLSFEVIGDAGVLSVGDVVADALDGPSLVAATPVIEGAVQVGSTRREAVSALLRLVPVQSDVVTGVWQVGESETPVHSIGEAANSDGRARERIHYAASDKRPTQIALGCYDPLRDFQSTVQMARVAGGNGAVERIDLAIAASAGSAKAIVGTLAGVAAEASAQRERPSGFAALAVPMGARAAFEGKNARITERKIEGAQMLLTLDEAPPLLWRDAGAGDGGRSILAPDQAIGTSVGNILDLPAWNEGGFGFIGGLSLAAAGSGAGWRGAVVEVSASAGALPTHIGPISPTPVLGMVAAVFSAAQAALLDTAGWIDVDLLRDDMALTNAPDTDLLAGANLAMAGDELLQFGRAEPMGNRRWRLSRLLRGRIGTDDAMLALGAGQAFTMIDAPSLLPLPSVVGLNSVGAGGQVALSGPGDTAAVVVPILSGARASRPLSPVHLTREWASDGALILKWIRRSRNGFIWADGVDVPFDERFEHYRIAISSGVSMAEMTSETPTMTLSSVRIAEWRAVAAHITIAVRQAGESGDSPPLTLTIAI